MREAAAIGPIAADQIPNATYRLQFNRQFTLTNARALVSYFHELGVSHVYASPLLKATPESTHGYDVSNFSELNPELGTPQDLEKFRAELERHRMGLILDVVPNHMGITGPHNHWWRDTLARGASSKHAHCFDIDWQSPDPRLKGKVSLPILAERYHEALAHGTIRLADIGGSPFLICAGQELPVSNETVLMLLQRADESVHKGGSAALRQTIDRINSDPKALDEIVQMQNYLPMFWRNGDAMLNYRRFFTITSLAGIRIEEPRVFDEVFALVKHWISEKLVDGLRVDHIDGMRRPKQFLHRLRCIAPHAPIYVEKILAFGETLNPSWPVEGTTGYDFLNNVCGLFIDPRGEKPLSDFYSEFTGETLDYPALVRAKKQMLIRVHLSAEASRLTELLVQIGARHWEGRDYTRTELGEAWGELATDMPVYRTYADADGQEIGKRDARIVRAAATAARRHRPDLPHELFDFLEELLLLRRRGGLESDFVQRFQQLTGPIMAKGVEDTAFYCYGRFLALNEVGGDPSRFGLGAGAFHQWCRRQQWLWPASMSSTSTHDTKRGADVRARLAILSEMPREWTTAVRHWSRMNEDKRGAKWPDRKTEYVFYQTLVGAWPLSLERAQAFMLKAAREAKENTDWTQPVPEYEKALQNFISEVFDDPEFIASVKAFVSRVAEKGWINSLSQTLLKLTAPGVPDIYQGSELWDMALADPDNRQPVDFELRKQLLTEARTLSAGQAWRRRATGIPNLWLTWKVLGLRRAHPDFFGRKGSYEPLPARGVHAGSVLAFMRGGGAVTIVPRLAGGINGKWADTAVELPSGRWRNAFTNALVEDGRTAKLFSRFPVALLLRETPVIKE